MVEFLQRLLHRGQETEYDKEPDYVLELRQTIQIMQEKLDERQGEANSGYECVSVNNIM